MFIGSLGATGVSDIIFNRYAEQEAMRLDSSGRLLVGTSSAPSGIDTTLVLSGNSGGATANPTILFARNNFPNPGLNADLGRIGFGNANYAGAQITGHGDGTWTSGTSHPTRLVFSTTADGASSPTERMRIKADGALGVGPNNGAEIVSASATPGFYFRDGNGLQVAQSSVTVAYFNRQTTDGTIVSLRQGGTEEGAISVSGSTVTYGGGHLARWSQLHNATDPSSILKGTVMSNLDEMCEWGEEDNEQLNKTKVSEIEGDPNVAGVFVSTSFDEVGPLDFFVAMTGDMIIRIAEGVTVQRGDLLMSAGNGTAKPQDDDIIRSKTIAKVTSTHVTCTYDDGSYCVPCVLMAC
jgi:hypothetical protein